MIEKQEAVELLNPLLAIAHKWFLGAFEDYMEIPTRLRERIKPGARAFNLHDFTFARMSEDSALPGHFVPMVDTLLKMLTLDGEDGSPEITLLLKKADRWKGRLRTHNIMTERQRRRRHGQLTLYDIDTIPLVFFYELSPDTTIVEPRLARVGLGYEGPRRFLWTHTLWNDADGLSDTVIMPQLPLIPAPAIKLRKPDQTQLPVTKVSARRTAQDQDVKRKTSDGSQSTRSGA